MNLPLLAGLLIVGSIVVVIALGLWLANRRRASPPLSPVLPPVLRDADHAEVARLLAQNQKLQAIKLVRDRSGSGLREAKEYVEQIERSGLPFDQGSPPVTAPVVPSEALAHQVRDLLVKNQKIVAIKLVRETTGWGLRESKDYVEQIEREG